MKRFKYIFTIAFLAQAFFSFGQATGKIDPVEFKASYFKYRGLLLDVRTPEEFQQGHIEGSQNIDVSDQGSFEEALNSLDKDKPVFVYCGIGVRSARAASLLRRKGFTKVFDLSGGYEDLIKAGMKSTQ